MVFVWFLGVAAKDDCTLPQEKVWEIQILERGNYFFVFFWGRLDRSHFTLPQKEVLEIQVLEGRNYSICLSLFWLAPHGTISWREHESFHAYMKVFMCVVKGFWTRLVWIECRQLDIFHRCFWGARESGLCTLPQRKTANSRFWTGEIIAFFDFWGVTPKGAILHCHTIFFCIPKKKC